MRSRLPVRGFNQSVLVIRKIEGDDGFGGISLTNSTVYASRKCRITTMSDKDEREGYGESSGQHWNVTMELSKGVQRSDFISVPWGVFPNVETAGGLTGEFPPQVIIATPAGAKTLVWYHADSKYSDADANNDPANNYTVHWAGSNWRFVDTPGSNTTNFSTDYEQHHNIFNLDWATLVGGSYGVTSQTDTAKEYRILYCRHVKDDRAGYHHTSMIVELEESDDEDE